MEEELLKKAKKKRIRNIVILLIIALFAGLAVLGLSLKSMDSVKDDPAVLETVETAQAPEEDPTQQPVKVKKADPAKAEAKAFVKVLKEIPEEANLTLEDKDTVAKARTSYDALSEKAKKKVTEEQLGTLTSAEKKIKDLEEEKLAKEKADADAKKKAEEKAKKEAAEAKAKADAEAKAKKKAEAEAAKKKEQVVTIEITCKEMSDHMDRLKNEAIADYIPKDGKILGKTKYQFEEGETVWDCLRTVCNSKGIQIDSKKDSVYGVYVKGINYLYEFDGGKNSGWMYDVNGETPNYGCASYDLKKGDKIKWYYTINYKNER